MTLVFLLFAQQRLSTLSLHSPHSSVDAAGGNGREALRKHVDKTTVAICDTGSNYKTNAVFINESGLYSLILGPASDDKNWLTRGLISRDDERGLFVQA